MLTITSNAVEAIRAIVESTDSPAPLEGDEVLDAQGAHVFLDELAVLALEDKSLDAQIEGGEISFGIVQRDEDAPEPPL